MSQAKRAKSRPSPAAWTATCRRWSRVSVLEGHQKIDPGARFKHVPPGAGLRVAPELSGVLVEEVHASYIRLRVPGHVHMFFRFERGPHGD